MRQILKYHSGSCVITEIDGKVLWKAKSERKRFLPWISLNREINQRPSHKKIPAWIFSEKENWLNEGEVGWNEGWWGSL